MSIQKYSHKATSVTISYKLYWQVGEYISKKIESSQWGEGVVDNLATYIQTNNPEFKGFTRRGLYRMRQFHETYRDKQFVSAVLTQISWIKI